MAPAVFLSVIPKIAFAVEIADERSEEEDERDWERRVKMGEEGNASVLCIC